MLDKVLATESILQIPDRHSWWDNYRQTKMIPLMSKTGQGISNYRDGEFLWTEFAPKIITEYFEEVVFDWLGCRSRLMALITAPNCQNGEHIDCEPKEVSSRQHKFRIVLQGQTSTLYFKTIDGDVHVPDVDDAFIMDGGWPHGMNNCSADYKVTLALGSPWTGKDTYDDVDILMSRNDYCMPNDLSVFFKK